MVMIRHLVLIACCVAASASTANAATYQKTDSSIVPILEYYDLAPHPYSGPNLEPFADLTGANLNEALLEAADLRGANLTGARFELAVLRDADLTNANLTDSYLNSANLRGAHGLTAAQLLSASNLIRISLSGLDFSGQSFAGITMIEAGLSDTTLVGSNFSGADLSDASFGNADLRDADFTRSGLGDSYLDYADLSGADFSSAYLQFANLTGAIVDGTNFSGAYLADTDMDLTIGSAFYNANTRFHDDPAFDPVAAGWVLIPEPSTALLLSLGLVGLTNKRRLFDSSRGRAVTRFWWTARSE